MSLHRTAPAGGAANLRPLTRDERVELLTEAVLTTYERFGVPLSDEAETYWHAEVDALYRACLFARRSAPPRSFEARARCIALMNAAARPA